VGVRRLIKGATVVTLDARLGDFERADILVDGSEIAEIGVDLAVEDAEVIDADGCIAIPGFVNTHLHTWQHALRGVCADWTVKDYTRCWRIHLGPMYRPEDMRAANYVGALDSLNAGTTTILDYCHNLVTRDHAYAAIEGLRSAGVRALFGYSFIPVLTGGWGQLAEVENPDLPDHQTRQRFATQLAGEEFSSPDDLVRFGIVPQEMSITVWEETVAEFTLARELGAHLSLHANQLCSPTLLRDIAKLGEGNLLGDDLVLVHCTFSTDEELGLIAESGTHVCVAPETEMQMGMGLPVTGRLKQLGVPTTIGADITSNNSGDMFFQMRLALQTGRMLNDIPNAQANIMPEDVTLTTREALEWATINGARAMGLGDRVGSLTPGKQADITLIDTTAFNLAGWNRRDPVGTVVLHAHSGNVDTVLVGGDVVKRYGKLVNVDPVAAVRELEQSQGYVRAWADANGGVLPEPRIELTF
jgi:5-methylthioadenosine/S-adenosylhomocysteine deaminase